MEDGFIILGVIQAVNLFVYRWVGKVFTSQPRFNHPKIFHNPLAQSVLCYGPMVTMAILVILAFVLTNSPWIFLGLTLAGFVAFSARPHPEFMR